MGFMRIGFENNTEDRPKLGAMQFRWGLDKGGAQAQKGGLNPENSKLGYGFPEKALGPVPFTHRRVLEEQCVGVRPQFLL